MGAYEAPWRYGERRLSHWSNVQPDEDKAQLCASWKPQTNGVGPSGYCRMPRRVRRECHGRSQAFLAVGKTTSTQAEPTSVWLNQVIGAFKGVNMGVRPF